MMVTLTDRSLIEEHARAMDSIFMHIRADYMLGLSSRTDTTARLIELGMSLVQAREEINSWDGENGNDNGC